MQRGARRAQEGRRAGIADDEGARARGLEEGERAVAGRVGEEVEELVLAVDPSERGAAGGLGGGDDQDARAVGDPPSTRERALSFYMNDVVDLVSKEQRHGLGARRSI